MKIKNTPENDQTPKGYVGADNPIVDDDATDYDSVGGDDSKFHGTNVMQEVIGGFKSEQNPAPDSPMPQEQIGYNTKVGLGPLKGSFTK